MILQAYRRDAESLEKAIAALGGAKLEPNAEGAEVQKTLARLAEKVSAGQLAYNRFFAIGLFRLAQGEPAKGRKSLILWSPLAWTRNLDPNRPPVGSPPELRAR